MLGATGRLGRMVRAVWSVHPAGRVRSVARGGGADLSWAPGDATGDLPRVGAIVALWGVVPGAGDLSLNADLARAAMDLGAELGADRVIHCSSAAVYGPAQGALGEGTALAPVSPYGRAKQEMEQAVADCMSATPDGPRGICLRIGNVAGAESLFAAIAAGPDVTLDRFADGQGPRRSYIAPSDLAAVLLAVIRAPLDRLPDVLNVAAPATTAMADIARAAGRDVRWRDAPDTALAEVRLDTAALQSLFDLGPTSADPHWLAGDAARWGGAS